MILERLSKDTVIGDGGSIFELERRGYVSAGPFTPEAVVKNPEAVRQMQVDFASAGADVIQACTYYAHEEKLKVVGLADALKEINTNATMIAREVASEFGCIVAGNLSNTWVYDPADPSTHAETRRQFDEQIKYQSEHKPDFFIAETIEYLGEALIALKAIRDAGFESMITLGFKYRTETLDGVEMTEAFRQIEAEGAEVVGINCFRDPERMLPLAKEVRGAVKCAVATQPVAYRCSEDKPYFQIQMAGDHTAFPLELDSFTLSRLEMADYALKAREMGINYIGSCCGSGPHHVRAMAEALGRTPRGSEYSPKLELHPIIGDDENVRELNDRILCEQKYGKAHCHFLLKEDEKK